MTERGGALAAEHLELVHGALRFPARAQGAGPVVLCLHGFPDDFHSFDQQLAVLAGAGFRAVAVCMRGYGPGCQPADGDYSLDALVGDVRAWIAQLAAGPVHLLGHDWGAVVTYLVAARHPEQVASASAIAVPHAGRFVREVARHPRQLRLSWYMGFFQLPVIPERWVARRDFAFLRRLWRSWSPGWDFGAAIDPVLQTFRMPGVVPAALAYYRQNVSPGSLLRAGEGALPRDIAVPTLCITGADDGCIDSEVFAAMTREGDFPAGLRLERIPGAGHWPHRERADAVNALLLGWLGARG
jgi:pimeloyl-ACP methyl ester carboxylesterase